MSEGSASPNLQIPLQSQKPLYGCFIMLYRALLITSNLNVMSKISVALLFKTKMSVLDTQMALTDYAIMGCCS